MKQFQMGKKERVLELGFQPEKRACSQKHLTEFFCKSSGKKYHP